MNANAELKTSPEGTGAESNSKNSSKAKILPIEREFTAKQTQNILRSLLEGAKRTGSEETTKVESEKIGLALLNYYARTELVPPSGKTKQRGRRCYTYADIVLLCWLFRMKREGLPVNRFRRGIAYLRKRLPKLFKEPKDMVLLTDGKQLFLKNRIDDREGIVEVLTGSGAGQYVWAYSIGSLIAEVDRAIDLQSRKAA